MKKNEAAKLIFTIKSMYPNFMKDAGQQEIDMAVETWAAMCDYEFNDMMLALKTFSNTSGSAFAPSIAQLIACVQKTTDLPALSEGEAWSLVEQSIRKSSYYAEEEFEKLKSINPCIAKAIGAPSALRAWAADPNYNPSVVSSNFMRSYRRVVEYEKEMSHMPQEAKLRLQEIREGILAIEGEKR